MKAYLSSAGYQETGRFRSWLFRIAYTWLLWLADNSRLITATALALLTTFGVISLINNVQEIVGMRSRLSIHKQ